MGSGDLNMKKSWFPGLIKNRARVWEDQEAARQERKRAEQLRKEIEQERQANELQRLSELAGAPKKKQRVEFLYAGGGAGSSAAMEQEREAYLLGKKRIDDVLGKDVPVQGGAALGGMQEPARIMPGAAPGGGEINLRDLNNKVALDPLLAIKRQEAAQVDAMVAKVKAQREAALRKEDSRRYRESSRDRSSRHAHTKRDGSVDRHDRRRSKEDDRRDRRRSRSRDGHRRRDYREGSRDRHGSRREDRYRRRERSKSRSQSPPSRRHERRRSPVPVRQDDKPEADADAMRAQRLAAMSSAARELNDVRLARLTQTSQEENQARLKEQVARERDATVRGGSTFVRDLQLGAGLART